MTGPVLQSAKASAFADLWYEARAAPGVPLPFKNDLPLRRLASFMPHIALVRHEEDGRARYVLFGTALVATFGRDYTGDYVDGPMTDEARSLLTACLTAFHEAYGEDAVFGRWTIGEAHTSTGRLIEFENLTLPYIDDATSEVRFMSCVVPLATLDYGEAIAQRFPDRDIRMFAAAEMRPDWLRTDPHAPSFQTTEVA